MGSLLDKLVLETSLDLLQHLAQKTINLPEYHVFASIAEFCHVVATNKARVLYLLVRIVAYDVVMYNKVLKEYFK